MTSTLQTIYVVYGTCGEYSDRREWTVRAYTSERAAQAKVAALQEAMRALGFAVIIDMRDGSEWYELPSRWTEHGRAAIAEMCAQHDPSFSTDSGGTRYDVYPVTLEGVP